MIFGKVLIVDLLVGAWFDANPLQTNLKCEYDA